MSARYAVYFVPADDSALALFGNRILGRDASAKAVAFSPETQDHPLRQSLASVVSRYGFHATLKAPFELRADQSEQRLRDAITALAKDLSPVLLTGLRPCRMNRHIVLSNQVDSEMLLQLAKRCVVDFEPFRAPNGADLHRRTKAGMSSRQLQLLEQYGYASVFEFFTFHMTLGGPIPDGPALNCVGETSVLSYLNWLGRAYDEIVTETPVLDRLVLSYQPDRQSAFVRLDEWVF